MGNTRQNKSITPYQLAYVYNGEKEWFVAFQYYSLTKQKYVREKVRMAFRNLTFDERQARLELLRDEFNLRIRQRNRDGLYQTEVKGNTIRDIDLVKATEIISCDALLKKSTLNDVSGFKYNYSLFVEKYKVYKGFEIVHVGSRFLTDYITFLHSEKYSSKTINKYLWVIQYMSEYLQKKGFIDEAINTESYRVKQIKNETGLFRPLTHEEKKIIFDHCKQHKPHLYLYIACIYYSCIRPGELRRLQIKDFDLKTKTIHVSWMNAKNGLSKHVQILEPLYQILSDAKITDHNPEWCLFSNQLKPGKSIYNGKGASDYWRHICDNLKIDKTANMYGLKHTFNVDYVEKNRDTKSGINWEWLRRHNRHATIQQTQEYISGLAAYFLDEKKNIILNYHNS